MLFVRAVFISATEVKVKHTETWLPLWYPSCCLPSVLGAWSQLGYTMPLSPCSPALSQGWLSHVLSVQVPISILTPPHSVVPLPTFKANRFPVALTEQNESLAHPAQHSRDSHIRRSREGVFCAHRNARFVNFLDLTLLGREHMNFTFFF